MFYVRTPQHCQYGGTYRYEPVECAAVCGRCAKGARCHRLRPQRMRRDCSRYGQSAVWADRHWLRNIKDVIRLYADELDAIKDDKERRGRLVELNVIEQVKNLGMTSIVQNAWHRGQELNLHGLMYHVGEGILKDLKIDVSEFRTLDAPK